MEDAERLAHLVVLGEFEGNRFSWEEARWLKREEFES